MALLPMGRLIGRLYQLIGIPSGSSGGGGGAALSAPTITRITGATTYPPQVSFTRPSDWIDGDQAVMQWSTDPTFATGVTTGPVVTLYAATSSYSFGLSAIASGTYYIRMATWRGTQPGSLNWSNVIGVGSTTAPTITSTSASGYQYLATALTLTASETVTWSIDSGTNYSLFSISGNVLSLPTQVPGTYSVNVTATDLFGNSATSTITFTIAANPATLGSFTKVAAATASTQYTSNTITVSGGQPTTVWPYTIAASATGAAFIKRVGSGSFVAAGTSGTTIAGDQFYFTDTAPATASFSVSDLLIVGAVSAAWKVVTSGWTPDALWIGAETGDWWDVNDLGSMYQDVAGTIPVTAVGQSVARWVGQRGTVILTNIGVGSYGAPTLQNDGTANYLNFGSGTNLGNASASMQNASDGTRTGWAGFSVATLTSNFGVLSYDDGGTNRQGYPVYLVNAALSSESFTNVGAYNSPTTTITANTTYSAIGRQNATTVEAIVGGSSLGTTSLSGTPKTATQPFALMYKQAAYQGRIYGTVGMIGRAISNSEATSLNSYITARL